MTVPPDNLLAASLAGDGRRRRPRRRRRAAPPATRKRGDELELTIESLAFGGDGVARYGDRGYVVFVAGAVPGDRVRAFVNQRKRSHAHARTIEVLDAGPDRVPAVAQHPGAAWQILAYERQLEVKRAQVEEALRRLGGLDGFELDEIVPALETWRYRNKMEYSFGSDAEGELVCGLHATGSWHRIVPMDDCLLASHAGNEVRAKALQWCRGQGLRAWDRRGGGGLLRNLVVREGRRTGALQVRLVTAPGELDVGSLAEAIAPAGLLWTRIEREGETTQAGWLTALVSGEAMLPERLGALELRISPQAFFQTNTEMAEVLYGVAARHAALQGWERVFDLYSGIGTIALELAPRAGEVWGLEIVEDAVVDAKANARANDITNAHFVTADARVGLPALTERAGRPDLLVVDPPRAGLSQRIVGHVIDAAPRRIVYVSCNPSTLAPNAAQLVAAGYVLTRVSPVDMFPQTPHIECVASFQRAGSGGA